MMSADPYTALQVNCLTETGYAGHANGPLAIRALELAMVGWVGFAQSPMGKEDNRRKMRQERKAKEKSIRATMRAEAPSYGLVGIFSTIMLVIEIISAIKTVLDWLYTKNEKGGADQAQIELAASMRGNG